MSAPDPIMMDCVAGERPHYLSAPILVGAPSGILCRACGQEVEVDEEGLTKPHRTEDVLAMLERGDYG
jgi:hypothetical protein